MDIERGAVEGSFRGDGKGSIDDFDKGAFFAKDQAPGVRHGEVLPRLRMRFQAGPIGLVRREALDAISPQATSFVPSCGRK